MDFELTRRQQDVYDQVGALGREKFGPRAHEFDVKAETPRANMKDFFDAGLMGLTVGEDMGGAGSGAMGTDPLLYLLAVEQTARYCLSTAHCFHIHCHGAHLVDQVGTKEQRERILGAVIGRGAMLNATASEPGRTARGLYGLVTAAERVDERLRRQRQEELHDARRCGRVQRAVRRHQGRADARRPPRPAVSAGREGRDVRAGLLEPDGHARLVQPHPAARELLHRRRERARHAGLPAEGPLAGAVPPELRRAVPGRHAKASSTS